MIHTVGGIYREVCWEGAWDQWYGSGLRAAAVLSSLQSPTPQLTGLVSDESEQAVESIAAGFVIDLHLERYPHAIHFEYEHALAVPRITPPIHTFPWREPLDVNSECVLRFGMIECDARVNANWATYDPQAAHAPKYFRENGSTAKQLAVVCNRREARLLTGQSDVASAISTIVKADNATVVVVKDGANGAQVFHDGALHQIPCFATQTVWPIGSGDVFSAAFAYGWMEGRLAPAQAALQASRAVAAYCGTRVFPNTSDLTADFPVVAKPCATAPTVYLAGPFFNMMQRWMIRNARMALRDARLRVFSPFHDVGHGLADDVAKKDLQGIQKSQAMFAIGDGLDSGTLFEIGYAVRHGIPVVVFVQDETAESLKMLEGSGCEICNDFVSAIYRTAWLANG